MKKAWTVGVAVVVVIGSLAVAGALRARAADGVSLLQACNDTGYKFTKIDNDNYSFQFEGEFGETWKIIAGTKKDFEYVIIWTTIQRLGKAPSQELAVKCLELNDQYGASFMSYDSEFKDLDCQMAAYKPVLSGELLKDALRQVMTMADDEYRSLRKLAAG